MSRTVRIVGVVLVALSVLLVLSSALTGVVFLDGIRVDQHTSRTFAVDPAPTLTVRSDAADITVVAGSPGQVLVEQDVHVRALTRGLAEAAVRSMVGGTSATAGAVDVRADRFVCCSSSAWVNEEGDTLLVRLPPDATLRIETSSGDVSMSGLSGPVDVRTESGHVTLARLTATGPVRVRSQSGSVDVSGVLRGGGVDLQTSSGGIVLGIPSDTSARLSAATESGSISVDRTWSIASSSHAVSGTLGSGTDGDIRLQTASGDIRIGAR